MNVILVSIVLQNNEFAAAKVQRRILRDHSNPLDINDAMFLQYYRINKDAFHLLLNSIKCRLPVSSIPAQIQLAATLRFLAEGGFQRGAGKDSDVALARSTTCKILNRMLIILERHICARWITLIMSDDERNLSKRHFMQKFGIPGVIGCVDGTHVEITKPHSDGNLFYNRKGRPLLGKEFLQKVFAAKSPKMSRFGLRSCSDGLKCLEEKQNCKSTIATLISSKRTENQNNDEHLIDIKSEAEEIEKYSHACDKLSKNKNGTGIDENDNEDGEHNVNNVTDEGINYCRQQSPIWQGSLVCSFPLDRINEIIQKLNLHKSKVDREKEPDEIMIDEALDNDDDEEDDANISKQSTSNIKNLCLYCDRKFSSYKMQLKHVDKFHCLQQDRRCSGRNAQLQQYHIIPRTRKSATGSQKYPGCNFCQKIKGQLQPVILPSPELNSLFLHLTDCHTDKYFGCKMCVIRFQNISQLSKHMELVHKSLPYPFDETSSKSKDNDAVSLLSIDKLAIGERGKLAMKRQQRSQKSLSNCMNMIGNSHNSTTQCSSTILSNTSVMGAEEPILSRLGLTQNRLPNNRKGVRLRREKLLPEMLLKSEQNHTSPITFAYGTPTSISSSTTCSTKLRSKAIKAIGGFSSDANTDVFFRVPTRNDILSCVFDDNFYREVVSNVRNNLLFHLDGKIMGNSKQELDTSLMRRSNQPQIRSTTSLNVVATLDSEIHAATSLSAITAFPTLLTADQFGGDTSSSKIRRPHTKNSWKWKWDSVKKFKLINEGGKIVKKMKHPMLGLRDLSKLDMWTQLTMRQKHEFQEQQKIDLSVNDTHWLQTSTAEISTDRTREEKQRINEQLNLILDMRLLPHIILEQNEQAIIKIENDEFGISPTEMANEDCGDNFMAQTFADESFLSMVNLLPKNETQNTRIKLVLSGEWARPRCYLCICCGSKFEKLKSLEEHKMFRHSQILSTHYEVVGRELLNGNLLRHLFIPKKALSRYGSASDKLLYCGAARRLFSLKHETLIREITNNEESSDSLQSVLHSCATNSPSIKNSSSSTEDCDIDSKIGRTAPLQLLGNASVVSPTHSIQSFTSSSSSDMKRHLKTQTSLRSTPIINTNVNSSSSFNSNGIGSGCSKCGRKSNGVLDLYRHMLDCSGDYIWSLAKKRKYRYYCGSKKRRPCNKHSIIELRKNKIKPTVKSISVSNDNTTEAAAVSSSSNFNKIKTSPRSRPSDAESIKKMLENLPPKRICKKILPTLSKTKKSIKKITPKLLAKHKIYSSLRKTRVRQLAQAAKILSKTKMKIPNKMTTRATNSTISCQNSNNLGNKSKKSSKIIMTDSGEKIENPECNEDTVKNNNVEKFKDEVDCCRIKTEKENIKDVFINEIISIDKPKEAEENVQMLNKTCKKPVINNSEANFAQLSKSEKLLNSHAKQTSEIILNTNCGTLSKDIPLENQLNDKLNKDTLVNTIRSANCTEINMKSVKRSKRISDCIAMLTGKLEEKLKTEQKIIGPLTPGIPTITALSFKATSPISSRTIHQPILPCPKSAENVEIGRFSPKKTPKRKAISRRIIKSNGNEIIPLPVLTASSDYKTNVKLKAINSVEIMPPKLNFPSTQQISPTEECVPRTTSVRNLPELMLSERENKQGVSFIHTTDVPSMPPSTGPSTPSILIPKLPDFIPLDNVRQPPAVSHISPLGLPMPLPVPVEIPNYTQASTGSISTTLAAAVASNMVPTSAFPIITSVPAHLSIPPALQLTVSSYNSVNPEPLNLSNSSKTEPKQSQDLSCGVQRMSGIPTRRQTICGFETRNFAVFDEIEPLDLSKKSCHEKTLARRIELTSLILPPPQATIGVPNEPSVLTIQPVTSETLLNKPFYSNLDLLRIPQVRNPVGGQGTSEPLQIPIINNTTPSISQSTKTANKKRNKAAGVQTIINACMPPIGNTGQVSVPNTNTYTTKVNRDTINTNSKKESYTKNKSLLRMDEEVINHIDDAINSVINAVKASVDSEEALKVQQMLPEEIQIPSQHLTLIKPTVDANAIKESIGVFNYLTVARRNMRSKTLDSRPTALSKVTGKSALASINQQQGNNTATKPSTVNISITSVTTTETINNKNKDVFECLDNKTKVNEYIFESSISEVVKDKAKTKADTSKTEPQLQYSELESQLQKTSTENIKKQNESIIRDINEESNVEKHISASIVKKPSKQIFTQAPKPSVEHIETTGMPTVTNVEDAEAKTNTTNTISTLDLEHMSNNNNTSSGFHSSAQSDQQASVMSTSTSAVSVPNTATGADTKKKQRRRRKNELAAIVADQLLESFKLDKARRDNLKKLENLAYEKSEDLLLTGMLLMSSTKRNVTSSACSNINSQVENTEGVVSIKRSSKSQRNNQIIEKQKQNDFNALESKPVPVSATEKSFESDKDPLVAGFVDAKKNNRRRQYRRRGNNPDSENISKLKSSLESFSIDIERQLTEYEAKNMNVIKNVPSNESAKLSCSSKKQVHINSNKTSIILRPSILSVTLDSCGIPDIPQTPTKALTNDSNKTVVSSRDPRLNKNIHKEGERNNELATTGVTRKNNTGPEEIGDLEEDNYLTEIAKNVNEKIMSTENEEFAFKNDGFELVNEMEDSNSKFSRPPTSLSVRSAPNFNDDRSNFGSICDENTNTEVMDMDLDDDMSVYTSYSQDLGRCTRRKRRRRSILLTRKPKKRALSRDISAEKIECILCKKVFYSANSLSKHNMTLAHVSKVSEQEYLLSKTHCNITNSNELQSHGTLDTFVKRSTRRSIIAESSIKPPCESSPSALLLTTQTTVLPMTFPIIQSSQNPEIFDSTEPTTQETHNIVAGDLKHNEATDNSKSKKSLQKFITKDQITHNEYDVNTSAHAAYNENSRLNLNPDERLFFECCNILKSAETHRLNNAPSITEECHNNANFSYAYNHQEKSTISNINVNRSHANNPSIEPDTMHTSNVHTTQFHPPQLTTSNIHAVTQQCAIQQQPLFRDPQSLNQLSWCYKGPMQDSRNARSPNYSGISHLSAVTNTTSRFKTKAAMKGYENVNIDLNQQHESKSRTICKLTELAEIALGNEEKPNSNHFSTIQSSLTPPQPSLHIIQPHQLAHVNMDNVIHPKGLDTPEYITTLVIENIRECNAQLPNRSERSRNNESRSSTSSKTIMHSSIIKAAVEEHQKTLTSNKIVIPDRPFKNIGLEEKATITFQKPKAPAVNLLTDDNNSISTGSFSDRDDYDFGSLSCDDDVSVRESNDKNQKNNTTESSSESSRATAKTFENKSLIMGRIFKNASTKANIKTNVVNAVKVKSIGVQKDQMLAPKADLNQLFDELRGNSGVDASGANEKVCRHSISENSPATGITSNSRATQKQYQQQHEAFKSCIPASSPLAVVSSTTAIIPTNVRRVKAKVSRVKSNPETKTRKNISKLQTELGMSSDEIKKLIDEGQRKSKRRCATNRPKKLIEMWSSDEYEEFLSTKDIIALIEEKEQQEKRKKRKNISTISNEAAKEKEIIPYVTSSTKHIKRRNTRRMSIGGERLENLILDPGELLPPKSTKRKKSTNKREGPLTANIGATNSTHVIGLSEKFEKVLPQKARGKKAKTTEVTGNSSTLTASDNNVSCKKNSNNKSCLNKTNNQLAHKRKQTPLPTMVKKSSRSQRTKRKYEHDGESNEDISVNDALDKDTDDDADKDFLTSELKSKQKKARRAKVKNDKSVSAVRSAIEALIHVPITRDTPPKKRSTINNINSNTADSSISTKNLQHNKLPSKTKRKNISNTSTPRRKRLATDKLYYWSSSSDEDFGLIDSNKSNPPPDNYESTGEQYKKHGWIVGDSHKKLVTLLAIAKGNKKIDSNSGVKKIIGKKRH